MRSLPPAPSSGKSSGGVLFTRCLALLFLMVTTIGLLSQQVQAADVPTGTIEGRVLNLSNGRYLSKALVKVEGTTIETLTNDFGEYTLREVPAGAVKITVFYTGQEPKTADVTVEAGKTAEKDIGLSQGKALAEDGTVVLDAYVVAQQRFRNAQEIAINEERSSTTIKSVVAADSLGHIPDGNIGEFVRFMPGIDVGYGGTYVNGADASSISVRGFGPENTSIMIDGMPVSSPSPASLTRAVSLDMLSINNASRIEVNKVATADMPADSPGGSINLITKSAFEYARPDINVELNATFNTMDMKFFHKQPGPINKKTYHTIPGGRVSVAIPLTKDLGFSVTVASDNKFQPNQKAAPVWLSTNSTTTIVNSVGMVGVANPFMRRFDVTDAPWNTFKQSGNIRLDWRAIPGLTINTNYQYSRYTGVNVSRRLQYSIERPADWDASYVSGRPLATDGSSKAAMNADARDKEGDTQTAYIKAVFTKGPWSIDAYASRSLARGRFDDVANGHFSGYDLSLNNIGHVVFGGIEDGVPAGIKIFNRTGQELDYTRLANWSIDNVTTLDAKSGEAFQRDTTDNMALNIRRELDFLPWKMGVKFGGQRQVKDQKKWGRGTGWRTRYVGPTLNALDILDDSYEVSPGFGYPAQQWADTYKLYQLFQAHPEYFSDTRLPVTLSENWNSLIAQKKAVKESSDSLYAMFDGDLFKNRLKWSGGARRKFAKVVGYLPYTEGDNTYRLLKRADHSVYRDDVYTNGIMINGGNTTYSTGAGTAVATWGAVWSDTALTSRLAAAGISLPGQPLWAHNALDNSIITTTPGTWQNNLELAQARRYTKDVKKGRWDPVTPVFALSYKVTENFDAKLSWSRETKLADLESGNSAGYISNATVTTVDGFPRINVSNPGLNPEKTNSINLALAYYTKKGGSYSVSGYYKRMQNEWEDIVLDATSDEGAELARSVGFDPTTLEPGTTIATKQNGTASGSSKTGLEVEIRQNLSILGSWAEGLDTFATYSYKKHATFSYNTAIINKMPGISQDKYSWGLSYSNKRLTVQARGTYATATYDKNTTRAWRGTTQNVQLFNYRGPEYRINVEAYYRISEKYSVFISASDLYRSKIRSTVRDLGTDIMPRYAWSNGLTNYGATVTTGVTGKF
ncbi:MAG: TonB-dependent receptor [Nibricoccus sp.]